MLPRGLRNNNPLNIIIGDMWQGRVVHNTDGTFVQFTDIVFGYRAAFIILQRYINKHGRNNIDKIIDAWAPDGEPAQSNYKKSVSKSTGIDTRCILHFEDRENMVSLVAAMAKVENGVTVDREPIYKAYDMVSK